ncbi:MAG: hypothetical protein JNM74_06225, partial [Myxococcales bacterium]|nr:hypothetical protein [Myxococcales bacterium]
MRTFFAPCAVVLVCCAVAGCSAESAEAPPTPSDESAIVGNTIADAERPEVVALDVTKDGKTFVCTGTIVG